MKTIIFDFDGTMADSFDAIIKIGYRLTKNEKLNDPDEIAKLRNSTLPEMARYLGISMYKLAYLFLVGRRQINKLIAEIEPYPDIKEVIKHFKAQGYDLDLLSSNNAQNIREFLINNDLNKYFSNVYSGIGLSGKTRALRNIMKTEKKHPDDIIYIANEPLDVEAAKNNKVKCIAAEWGYNNPENLREKHPFALAKHPKDLPGIIKEWDK